MTIDHRVSTFEDCRREAYRLLGDAADCLRYPDVLQSVSQRKERREALRLIGLAKDALNRAA